MSFAVAEVGNQRDMTSETLPEQVPDPSTEWQAANANVLQVAGKADATEAEVSEAWERHDRATDMMQRRYRPGYAS